MKLIVIAAIAATLATATAATALTAADPQPLTDAAQQNAAVQNATEQMLMEQLRARRDLQAQVLLLQAENAKLKSDAEKAEKAKEPPPK